MKPQELRIGNWLYRKGDNENMYEVDWITIKEAHNYQPIPITEEWLEKFGFCHDGIMWFVKDGFGYSFEDQRCNWEFLPNRFNELPFLDNVHQLQNLYYSLTSQELKLKE